MRRGIPAVVLLLVLGAVVWSWRHWHAGPKHEPAPHPAEPVPVSAITVRKETVPMLLRFLGQTEASQVVEVRARVAGYLEARSFTEGAEVEEGQELFQIDPRPFQVELAQARAGLASAQATLGRALLQVSRFEEAQVQGAATQQELEDWQTQAQVAEAEVQRHEAQIAAAELQLDYAGIESPIAGVIGEALRDTGSYVDAGQNGLLAIVQQLDPMYVLYSVTEQEILRFQRQVSEGQVVFPAVEELELEITLADGSTYPHRGRINFIDVQVHETTGTSIVRGEVPNPDGLLKPGQFIYATVLGAQRVGVVRVPQGAVLQSPAGPSVLVVGDDGIARSKPVELGDWSGTEQWIVERGLEPGDRVITDRLMMVRPGMPVTVAPAEPASTAGAGGGAPAEGAEGGAGRAGDRP
ncbi:MAG TPA: efflux RND transporter periplasmic adaptor subunit [Phycisphaerales bacterium]|nr:efflux RND transporter periplasmic adaptor subunit [Phycisphaerales bacterium]